MLAAGFEARHVQARIVRGSLEAESSESGGWRGSVASIHQSLDEAPVCGACPEPVTAYVIVKYPDHDRVDFSLFEAHGAEADQAHGRRGRVLEVVLFPYQSEGWIKPGSAGV